MLPKTYLVGATQIQRAAIVQYLQDTNNEDFLKSITNCNLSSAEIMCSLFAKLCYKSLSLGHNANISRTRDIQNNLINCFDMGHGSIFEHFNLNWITTNCSRVFTHELVRHRVGMAYSQTSGRYCRPVNGEIDLVIDPILKPVLEDIYKIKGNIEEVYRKLCAKLKVDDLPSSEKKKVTSALRRILPNGQTNEIAWSCNIRSLRHLIMIRTSRHAEWEIRFVFNQVYNIIKQRYPLMLWGAGEEDFGGLLEITGMRTQPYE